MVIATSATHSCVLGVKARQNCSARVVAVLALVLLVAGCKGTAVTGGWGNRVDPTGRSAGSGMDRGGSGGGY